MPHPGSGRAGKVAGRRRGPLGKERPRRPTGVPGNPAAKLMLSPQASGSPAEGEARGGPGGAWQQCRSLGGGGIQVLRAHEWRAALANPREPSGACEP